MDNQLTQFIINRVVADYLNLRRQGSAPNIEQYASFWPNNPPQLLAPLFLEEYRFRRQQGEIIDTETFLQAFPHFSDNRTIQFQILEQELRFALNDPDTNSIKTRFPDWEDEDIRRLVEQVLFYKVWHQKSEQKSADTTSSKLAAPTKQNQDAPLEATANYAPDIAIGNPPDATLDVPMNTADFSPGTSNENNWGEQKNPTVCWDNDDIRSTLDFAEDHYHEVVGENTVDHQATLQKAPTDETVGMPFSNKTKLKIHEQFDVRDMLKIEGYIGSGAWKDVYRARQISTRQMVAFKHLRESNTKEREALIREVRTQAQLTHQNIPPVFAFDLLDNGEAIVVEKLVDGSRWSDSMAQRTLDDNLRILLEVGQAIAYAHRRHQLIHRDLKPDNVVINDEFDEVYVIDWGLAVSVAPYPPEPRDSCVHISELVGIAGTPLYWAPEMARGETAKCCPASDVFLLGALLYEVLTGHPPYDSYLGFNQSDSTGQSKRLEVGPMLRSIGAIVFPPKERAPNRFIPDELAAIAMKAMSLEAEDRYADASDFVEAVKRYQRHAEATLRCDVAWKMLHSLTDDVNSKTGKGRRDLHPLTLRLIELSDTFHQVTESLTEDQDATVSQVLQDQNDPLEMALHSAHTGELQARQLLYDVTMQTGDLTLATAQVDLMKRNPFAPAAELEAKQRKIKSLQAARNRARAMKWVAVALLLAFLGSSILYGKLIDIQYKKTEAERQRAEANFQSAREVVNQFLTDFAKDDSLKNLGLMPLQRKLLDSAKTYYEIFVAQKSNDPSVLYEQMHALFDIGGIETRFGNFQEVASYYERAIDIGRRLIEKGPGNSTYLDLLAKNYKDLGVFYQMIEHDPATILNLYLKALEINRKLAAQYPDNMEYQRNLARIQQNLGDYWGRQVSKTSGSSTGMLDEAEKYYRDSLAVRERLKENEPSEYLYGSSQTSLAIGTLHYDEADRLEKERIDFLDRNALEDGEGKLNWSEDDQEKALAMMQKRDDFLEMSMSELKTSLEQIEMLKVEFPSDYGIAKEFLHGYIYLQQGKNLYLDNRLSKVEEVLLKAIDVLRDIVQKAPEDMAYQGRLNEAFILLYKTYSGEDKRDEQIALCRERIKSFDEAVEHFKDVPDYLFFWGNWNCNLAETLLELGRSSETTILLKKTIAEFEQKTSNRLSSQREEKTTLAAQRSLDDLYMLLYDSHFEEEHFDKQLEISMQRKSEFESLVKQFSENQDFWFYWIEWCDKAALALLDLGRPQDALNLLTKTIKTAKENTLIFQRDRLRDKFDNIKSMLETVRQAVDLPQESGGSRDGNPISE